jgi:preprotein translocase subunit SecA
LVEYKREAFEMFEDLMHDIQSTFTERFLKIQVSAEPPRPEPPARRVAAPPATEPVGADDLFTGSARRVTAPPMPGAPSPALNTSMGPVGRATAAVPEVGRNDPCPCGSGRKYKKCHGAGR